MKKKFMELAANAARINERNYYQEGGPFGAVIVKNGELIVSQCNHVIASKDPTAHAEINAIRSACQILGTHDLSGCELYTSCYPCPMCLSAIIWANIKTVYYGNTKEDAAKIGFRDDMIYSVLQDMEHNSVVELKPIGREETIKTFEEFEKNQEKRLY